ncbi:MAG: ubiquitin-activating E1 FCCH domain-containing protein [Smithellaceae bacterium]|jgi:hypothetical protein
MADPITALPTPPSRLVPSTFSTLADAFLAALPTFATEVNAVATALNFTSTTSTSSTSLTIGTGAQSLTVEASKCYVKGMTVKIAYDATNWMQGEVTSYNDETGALVVNVTITNGSGTQTDWAISLGCASPVATNVVGLGQTDNLIGTPGQLGFGVGVCPANILPAGMTPLKGYQDSASPNYGNYQFTDGSIMVYIPQFYYRMHTWGNITAITQANPAKVTQAAHGYVNGDKIFINNVAGMTQVNNLFYTVTKVNDNEYTIGVDSSGYGAYTSGGQATKGFGTGFEFNDTIITYGNNSIQIKGYYDFANATAANTAGYALHRAFYDGGKEQKGFFIDKYKNSKVANGTGYTAASIKGGKPLSSAATHNPFADLTGGANYVYSAVDLAHRRDGVNGAVNANSIFHVKSIFQNSALAMLSLVHGQYSQTDTYCAWYNATYNYPKGCNNNALKDNDDATVIYTFDGYSNTCTTGSGVQFAKTTHNGQDSGVADINGGMWEIELGVTALTGTKTISGISNANPCEITTSTNHGLSTGALIQIDSIDAGTLATAINGKIWQITKTADDKFTIVLDSSALSAWAANGTVTYGTTYATNTSVAMKSYTSGNSLATDHWGATGIAATMTAFTPPFKPGYSYAMRIGSGTAQVLSGDTSGANWLLTGAGFPMTSNAIDATGTNLFGKDYFYQYFINDMCLLSSGNWGSSTSAGVWNSNWSNNRTNANHAMGFRLACYPE